MLSQQLSIQQSTESKHTICTTSLVGKFRTWVCYENVACVIVRLQPEVVIHSPLNGSVLLRNCNMVVHLLPHQMSIESGMNDSVFMGSCDKLCVVPVCLGCTPVHTYALEQAVGRLPRSCFGNRLSLSELNC